MSSSTQNKSEDTPKTGLIRSIRNRFFTGVIVAFPIAVTVWLITKFVGFVDHYVLNLIPPQWNPTRLINETFGFNLPGIGLIIAIFALWTLGVLTSNFIGRGIIGFGEGLLNRVPLVSNLYNSLKQIVTSIAMQKDRAFKDVCLIEYPRKGLWAVGFITSDLRGAPSEILSEDHVCVFVPTTPNPTSGFLLFVKKDEVKILDMSPEEAAKMIISGGIVASEEDLENRRKNNLLLENS